MLLQSTKYETRQAFLIQEKDERTMKTLANEQLRIQFDNNGLISSLTGADGHEVVMAPGLWRIIYQHGDDMEIELLARDIPLSSLTISGSNVIITHESEIVKVCTLVQLKADRVQFDVTIENKSDFVISEFQFPYVNLGELPDSSLLWSSLGGELFNDLPATFAKWHSGYMGQDNEAIALNNLYPGQAAMNCFTILEYGRGLYFGSHDPTFQNTLHHLRSSDDGIRALLVKYPYIKKGESTTIEGFTIAPFSGSWHSAARIYRQWADSWFNSSTPPKWIREFNGWQRLIMRHQYGQTFFTYEDLPEMLADGMEAGIDTLLLFGWWKNGMDAGYPEYYADNNQGGFHVQKECIEKVHKNGGRVMLYFNGQLIDKATQYYREEGHRISVKDIRGVEHTETYNFGGAGTALRQFGNRVFTTGCFVCREWVNVLKNCIDIAIEAGVDAIFFDQFGNRLWPCGDPSHGHRVPDMRGFDTKAKIVGELHDYAESRKPGIGYGTEMVSDRLAPYVDFFHTVNCGYGRCWTGGEAFLEWFRYAFPEVIISDREIRDDKGDYKRRVNHALQMGLKSDVEIYRCRATIAEAPKYRDYLAEANALRKELNPFFVYGTFLDDVLVCSTNPDIRVKTYKLRDQILLFATHRQNESLEGMISLPGFEYQSHTGLGDFNVERQREQLFLELHADALVAILFREK